MKSSQQSSDRSCFCTNTRTTHTSQNKPYRLGVLPAGVVGARGRCCPAATVPVAVVFACGVCCCIAEEIQSKIIDRKTELRHHRPPSKRAQQRVREQHTQEFQRWVSGCVVRETFSSRARFICTTVVQIGVAVFGKGILPRRDGTVECNGRNFLDGNGRYELTVGEIVDGTGRDHGSILTTVLPSRPVPSLPSIPSRQ